ncbi:alpha/beta hydrolase family protein [Sandarakinorhabdus cyanobacteriorum]|nr:S9 family peptidase [Sandarakinorhabdus cyanobacteriorum]
MKMPWLLALALAVLPVIPALAAPPAIRLFGQLPNVSTIELSPDGSKWAAVMGDETSAQIQVRAVADNKLLAISPAEKSKLRDITWVGNDHLIATISTTDRLATLNNRAVESVHLLDLDLAQGGKWKQLLGDLHNAVRQAAGIPRPVIRDGRPYIVVPVFFARNELYTLSLAEVDLVRQKAYITFFGTSDTVGWMVGTDGKPAARIDYTTTTGDWRLMARQGTDYRAVYTERAPLDRPYVFGFGRDANTLLFGSHKSGEWEEYEVTLADGKISGPTTAYRGDRVITDRRTRTVVGTIDTRLDRVDYNFFDAADAALWRGLTRSFPSEQVQMESWSDDRQTIIVGVDGPKTGVGLFLIDRRRRTANPLALRYNGIGPDDLNPVTTFTYKAADGLDIPAYLTLPRGREAKGLPLIVLAHGGPAARDTPGFDWWAQALASRGYAVLQPQFRGSDGFGDAHLQAGYGQWGRKMQTDLSDGVRDLVKKGTVDAARVCIAGASYGGYAAMAGVALDPTVYRCASAVAGVSDLRRMLVTEARDAGGSNNATLRYWQRFMGAKDKNDTSIDAFSPARQVAHIKAPLQLIHGKDDSVVLLEQSQIMADALKAAGKPAALLVLPGEDHYLSRPATRTAMLEAQIAFLEKHNPPN